MLPVIYKRIINFCRNLYINKGVENGEQNSSIEFIFKRFFSNGTYKHGSEAECAKPLTKESKRYSMNDMKSTLGLQAVLNLPYTEILINGY
jgi:hypothetical protein